MNFLFTVRQNGCSIPVFASGQAGETATQVLLSAVRIAPNILRDCTCVICNNRAGCKECQDRHKYTCTDILCAFHKNAGKEEVNGV